MHVFNAVDIFLHLMCQVNIVFDDNNLLIKLDPLVVNKIKQNDTHRLIRAYEVIVFTKKSLIEWQKTNKNDFSNYRFIKIYINPENNLLHQFLKFQSH